MSVNKDAYQREALTKWPVRLPLMFQIDESLFIRTKTKITIELHQQVGAKFRILWTNVNWNDLRKPLYSALAANMYISLINDPVPPVYDINMQAEFWKTNFDTSGLGIEADFVAGAEALKSEGNWKRFSKCYVLFFRKLKINK